MNILLKPSLETSLGVPTCKRDKSPQDKGYQKGYLWITPTPYLWHELLTFFLLNSHFPSFNKYTLEITWTCLVKSFLYKVKNSHSTSWPEADSSVQSKDIYTRVIIQVVMIHHLGL